MTENKKLNKDYYYVYFMVMFRINTRPKNKLKLSWNEAIKLCQTVDATLPIIRSKQHQEEILSFLSSVFIPSPITVLFINLTTSPNSEEVGDIACTAK